jgi:hypothetical protein
MLLVIAMFIVFGGCYVGRGYVPIKLHKGEPVVHVDLGETLIVSEGYVHAAYIRWRRYMSQLAAQERLCMLSVTTNADGTWTIKKSVFWED